MSAGDFDLGGVKVPVASIEDLVALKRVEHEREQRRAWLALTPRQRLDRPWEAKSFALRAEEARRLRESPGAPPTPTAPGRR